MTDHYASREQWLALVARLKEMRLGHAEHIGTSTYDVARAAAKQLLPAASEHTLRALTDDILKAVLQRRLA